ncbi:unnamed protein product, partial [Chrysoparadoxa australica]
MLPSLLFLSKRCASSTAAAAPQLTREFIHEALYSKESGYFTSLDVIHHFESPIDFPSLLGEADYRAALADKFDKGSGKWMTPSEIFGAPFSAAVATYVTKEFTRLDQRQRKASRSQRESKNERELVIYELGAGSGTQALNFLNHLKEYSPDLYKHTLYHTVEISPRLAKQQLKRVGPHHSNFKVINQDILSWSTHQKTERRPCFVLAFELLDNLPQDKISWWEEEGGDKGNESKHHLCEAVIVAAKEPKRGDFSASSGSLVASLASGTPLAREHSATFVPTGQLQLVEVLKNSFPAHRAMMFDFDSLPPPAPLHPSDPLDPSLAVDLPLPAALEPLTSSRDRHAHLAKDLPSYLVQPGTADIFFPIDFINLQALYNGICRSEPHASKAKLLKQGAFMSMHAPLMQTKTRTGYNPLVEDFENT